MATTTPRDDAATRLRRRTLLIPELRDMVFKHVACGRSICRMRSVSHEFRDYYDAVAASLYLPLLFAAVYFQQASEFIDLVKSTGTVLCGYSVREYMYTLQVRTHRIVIITKEQHVDAFVELVAREHYTQIERLLLDKDMKPTCGYPTQCIRFARNFGGVKLHVSIQTAQHDPLRVLLCTTRPYALQLCDGTRFVDLYANLGAKGADPAFANGRYAHLLSPAQCARHTPVDVYNLYGEPGQRWTAHIERWIGDSHSWIVPRRRSQDAPSSLEGQGWTVRLHAKRPTATPYVHCWTDAHCRCLRHSLLSGSYVGPPAAVMYTKRVLDRIGNVLASGVGSVVVKAKGVVIDDFDAEVRDILRYVGRDEDYTFSVSDNFFSVDREFLSHE